MIAYTQSLLINRQELATAQQNNDVVTAQEILQHAFRTDVRSLVAEARLRAGGALQPIQFFRDHQIREQLKRERGSGNIATGL